MKTLRMILATSIMFVLTLTALWAAGPVETVAKGCQKEIEGFCKDVTPGQGRVLACLYAYGDKLSG